MLTESKVFYQFREFQECGNRPELGYVITSCSICRFYLTMQYGRRRKYQRLSIEQEYIGWVLLSVNRDFARKINQSMAKMWTGFCEIRTDC